MFVGTLRADLLLGDVRSLKQKRSVVRPLISAVKRQFDVCVAEVGHVELYRRSEIGVVVTSGDITHCRDVMTACEMALVNRPELEVLSVRQRLVNEEDL
ncbi:MAG: DUF503 domain-containing protein [Candidatus Nanopelagicales bacterium]